jgi:hypothetical protein
MNLRAWVFLAAAVACLLGVAAYVRHAAVRSEEATHGRDEPRFEWIDGVPADRPGVFFSSPAPDRSFKKVAFVPLDDLNGPRYLSSISCDRMYFQGGKGLCVNVEQEGLSAKQVAYLFDRNFVLEHRTQLTGPPSRIRISSDGQLGAITVFESGHSYAEAGFSTRTTLIDMTSGRTLGNLEEFRVERDGVEFKAVDFNFWGVTFIPGARRFYATVATRGKHYLIEGDVDNRSAHVMRDGVECPSLSPDGTKLAFKKRMTASGFRVGWQVAIMDLMTSRETVLDAERRSVDDQVEWLDNDHVLYFYPSEAGNNVWALNISNREPPRVFLKDMYSPAVVRQ